MKPSLFLFGLMVFSAGCHIPAPDERAVKQMLTTFFAAVERDDEDMARACLIDLDAFHELNPDVAARVDAESFTATLMAELIQNYRDMARFFEGRKLKVKSIKLGDNWYQYKGHQAFKDTEVIVSADGEEVPVIIRGIVRVEGKWRIVDLSGNDML